MVSISTINNTTQTLTATAGATTTVAKTTTATSASPTITNINSSTVKVSAAALTVAKAATAATVTVTVADALKTGATLAANTVIKDTAANISAKLKELAALVPAGNLASITFTDTAKQTVTLARGDIAGDLAAADNTDPEVVLLKKITNAYVLKITGAGASDALTLKAPSASATLAVAVSDNATNITTNLDALQAKVKAKTLTQVTLTSPVPTPGSPAVQSMSEPSISPGTLKVTFSRPDNIIDTAQISVAFEDPAGLVAALNADAKLSAVASFAMASSKLVMTYKANGLVSTPFSLQFNDDPVITATVTAAGEDIILPSANKPLLTITAKQLTADADALAILKGDFDLTITDVGAADALKVAGKADSILKASGSSSHSKISITDTAANISKNIAIIELAADAGRLTEITVSDGKELVLTEAQILAANDTVKTKFTSPTKLVVTDVIAKDAISEVNLKSSLTITETKQPITLPDGGKFNGQINQLPDGSLTWGNYTTLDSKVRSFIVNSNGIFKDITPENTQFVTIFPSSIAGNFVYGQYQNISNGSLYPEKMNSFTINKEGILNKIQIAEDSGYVTLNPIMPLNNPSISIQSLPVLLQVNYITMSVPPIMKSFYINGSGSIKEIPIVGASAINIRGTNSDGSLIWGEYGYGIGTSIKNFSINKYGVFKDITPVNSSIFNFNNISSDGSLVWGQYNDLEGKSHICILNADGQLKDVTPQGSISSSINGATTSGSYIWGQFQRTDNKNRAFITDKNGQTTDITPTGAYSSTIRGMLPDGSLCWGTYEASDGTVKGFIRNSNGTLTDITPQNVKNFNFFGFPSSEGPILGSYVLEDGQYQSFILSREGKIIPITPPSSMHVVHPGLFGSKFATCSYILGSGEQRSVIVDQSGIIIDLKQPSLDFMIEGNSPDGKLAWGRYRNAEGKQCLFTLSSDKVFKDITPPDSTVSNFTGMHLSSRQFAWGDYMKSDGTHHYFCLTQNGEMKEINLNGSPNFNVSGITNDGSVAWGQITDEQQNQHAFLLTKDGEFKILTPPGSLSSQINSYSSDTAQINASYIDGDKKLHLLKIVTNTGFNSLLPNNSQLLLSREEVKDTAANIQSSLKNLQSAVKNSLVSKITLTDKGTITLSYAEMMANLDALKSISGTYKLVVTDINVMDALALKAPTNGVTLSIAVKDLTTNLSANIDKLEVLAKTKSLASISMGDTQPIGSLGPLLTMTAKQYISAPLTTKLLQTPYQLNLTNALANDIIKLSSVSNLKSIQLIDTAANLAKNLTALEAAAKAGKIASVTVSDGKSLELTPAQIKTSENFLNLTFSGNAIVEAKDSKVTEFETLEALIEDNKSLVLAKQNIKDTAANIQAKLDQLDAAVEAGSAPSASGAFMLGNITVSDKGTITVTNSTFLKDLDALKVVSGAYKLNVTDINVTDALAIKAPSKDATLSLTIKDTSANVAANWDKLQALVKAKTLTNITLTDGSSSLLTMTAAQLKANADVLKVVTGDYKLSVTGVAAADVAKTLTTKNIYSVEVKDAVANILKNLPAIKTAVTAAKIQSVIITDATNPTLSIADIFALTTTLPNLTLAAGVKFNVKDTASNIVAHARYDIADVIKNAGSIVLSDKTPPNLTLADATTLKGLTGLAAGTKYNVADGGAVIAAQAALSGEKVLADAASVVVNKNFTITEAKAVSAIKSLAKGSAYSINDTADKILAQSALAGEAVLSKANAVNVVDTSANILAKLDQLQVLAKAGKIADIKFTDTPSGPLPLTDAQMLNNAEAIGKIVSQRALPTLTITPPKKPDFLGGGGGGGLTVPPPSLNTTQIPSLTNINRPTFSGSAVGNCTVTLYNNSSAEPWATVIADVGGNWSYTPAAGLADGSYSITGKTTSASGLQSAASPAIIFTIDTVAPAAPTLTGPTGTTTNNKPTFSGAAEANSIITLFNGSAQIGITTTNGSGSWTYTPSTTLIDGPYSITAKASDAAGNVSIKSTVLSFVLNTASVTPVNFDLNLTQISNYVRLDGLSSNSKFAFGRYTPNNDGGAKIFITKTDGIGFSDVTLQDAYSSWFNGVTGDGNYVWGNYVTALGVNHSFVANFDTLTSVKLTPPQSKESTIFACLPNKSELFGQYEDGGLQKIYIIQIDKLNFKDITPSNAMNVYLKGVNKEGNIAYGNYQDLNGILHGFVINTDGSNFIDITPQNYSRSQTLAISSDGSTICGRFMHSDGKLHDFISKTDGTGFKDISVISGKALNIEGFSNNNDFVWGTILNHNFIMKVDGTNFIDITPLNSTKSQETNIVFLENSNKIIGSYLFNGSNSHAFIMKTDGSGFLDLTPPGVQNCYVIGATEDENKIYCEFIDTNGKSTINILNADGSGYKTINSTDAVMAYSGFLSNDRKSAWNTYQTNDLKWHAYNSIL